MSSKLQFTFTQPLVLLLLILCLSCGEREPELLPQPDRAPPNGYIIDPLDGSSVSGLIAIQVLAIDDDEVDTVSFLIKSPNSAGYDTVDQTTQSTNDTTYNIWKGFWNTNDPKWIEDQDYFVTFQAVDPSGNVFIGSPIIVKVDNQDHESPVGYIKNPLTGQVVSGIVVIEIEATDNQGIQYVSFYINNELKETMLDAPYTYSWNTGEEMDDLVYSIYGVLVDTDNNRTTIPPISVTVNNQLPTDVTPPTGAITSPPAGATVSGITLIQVSAADDQLIDRVDFYIDGDLAESYACNSPNCTASYSWDTTEEDDMEHTIQVILVDDWNNNGLLTPINVIVDNLDSDETPPNVIVTEPASGQMVSGIVLIQAMVTDNIGVDRAEFSINGIMVHTDSSGPVYSYDWDTEAVADDQDYIISVIGFDDTGNTGLSTPITVYVNNYDNVPPSGEITYPYAGQSVSGIETITISAMDNIGVATVEILINGSPVTLMGSEPFQYEWDTTLETEDINHNIGIVITDSSGNTSDVPPITVIVDNLPEDDTTPPIIVISNPISGQTISGTVDFTVLSTDNVEVAEVEFFIDGISVGNDGSDPYMYVWDTTDQEIGIPADEHTLSALAMDTSGNISFAQPILVTVDN